MANVEQKTDLNALIDKVYWEELAKEGITKEGVDYVMLDIEFTPVTPFCGAGPCEVIRTQGEKYIVMAPTGAMTVTPDVLKVMRFRYLQFDPDRVAERRRVSDIFKDIPSQISISDEKGIAALRDAISKATQP